MKISGTHWLAFNRLENKLRATTAWRNCKCNQGWKSNNLDQGNPSDAIAVLFGLQTLFTLRESAGVRLQNQHVHIKGPLSILSQTIPIPSVSCQSPTLRFASIGNPLHPYLSPISC
ncbi:hypothetical protein SprV_0200756300 [Sparganum proliferum]